MISIEREYTPLGVLSSYLDITYVFKQELTFHSLFEMFLLQNASQSTITFVWKQYKPRWSPILCDISNMRVNTYIDIDAIN